MMSDPSIFTPETARAALNAILEALEQEDNAVKINEAKVGAGNDMLKVMQYVFPLIIQVEMDVIKKFGFTDNREDSTSTHGWVTDFILAGTVVNVENLTVDSRGASLVKTFDDPKM